MASVTFNAGVGGDGSTVTDDNNSSTGLDNGGHETRFIPALAQVVAVAGYVVTQADLATTQAGLATTQTGLATAQAGLAAASAASAASAYDSFDDRYLGSKASDPTTDNDGNALLTGALYWSTTTSGWKVWTGSAWVVSSFVPGTAAGVTFTPTTSNPATNVQDAIGNAGGVKNVVTATGMTTLTSTATLLSITPASYGIAVTLPDATTCSLGGPLHIIDNKGAYPVRVLNSAGTLLGFIFAGVVSHVSLVDDTTAAGVWTVENSELVGASAQLLTTGIASITACVALDSSREYIQGYNSSGYLVGVIYNKPTNAFGNVTAIRTVAGGSNYKSPAVLSATDQILCCSCGNGAATFEAVILSISGTTITVNTAATATLSANISAFADGCGLIAVGSSFVTSYTVATPAAQIRALSISGTTVTIGSASVLAGGTASSANGRIVASGNVVIAASYQTGSVAITVEPYTVSGTTLTLGTSATTGTTASNSIRKLFALGTRWCLLYRPSTADIYGAVVSLSGNTVTMSTVAFGGGISDLADAIVIGSNKVLMLGSDPSGNANILTDTAGTASAGTPITLSSQSARACAYVSGTDVVVGEATGYMHVVDCSGASPIKTKTLRGVNNGSGAQAFYTASNSVLSRSPVQIYGTEFAQVINNSQDTSITAMRFKGKSMTYQTINYHPMAGLSSYRGKADSERWLTDAATVITKIECVI